MGKNQVVCRGCGQTVRLDKAGAPEKHRVDKRNKRSAVCDGSRQEKQTAGPSAQVAPGAPSHPKEAALPPKSPKQKGLYVLEENNWIHCKDTQVTIHGLGMSSTDEDLDLDWACIIMGQLVGGDFKALHGQFAYSFSRGTSAQTSARDIALSAQSRDLGCFVLPEVTTPMYKLAVGLAFRSSKADKRAMLIGMDDVEYFRSHVKIK